MQSLTPEQEKLILEEWNSRPDNPPSLLELVRKAFPESPDLDGRSTEGRLIKKFLASRQIKARASWEYIAKEKIVLTDEQKEYIANNVVSMNSIELANEIFGRKDLSALHAEARAVSEYIAQLPTNIRVQSAEGILDGEYQPPKSEDRVIARINRYVLKGIDRSKLSGKEKMGIYALIGYLHTYRFIHQMNTYRNTIDRELFESSFIRYTYDKPDLTQEEVDQYIILSTEVVISSNIQNTIGRLERQMNDEYDEHGKIPMNLVEAINSARKEYNDSTTRQQKLTNDLKVKRSDRLNKRKEENASVVNLVEMWKNEEDRQRIIELAEKRKKIIQEEVGRLSSMEELKARILGLSEQEAIEG